MLAIVHKREDNGKYLVGVYCAGYMWPRDAELRRKLEVKEPKNYLQELGSARRHYWTVEEIRNQIATGLPVYGSTDTDIVCYENYQSCIETERVLLGLLDGFTNTEKLFEYTAVNGPKSFAYMHITDDVLSDALTEIHVPTCVTLVSFDLTGMQSFDSVECVSLPDTLDKVTGSLKAFKGLRVLRFSDRLKGLPKGFCTGLQEIQNAVLPKDLLTVGAECFKGCTQLTHVDLPKGLLEIQTAAFSGCEALQDVVLPSSLRRLDGHAFYKTGIRSVKIPMHVTMLGSPFAECNNLEAAYLPTCTAQDAHIGAQTNRNETMGVFAKCAALKHVVVYGRKPTFRVRALEELPALEHVELPDTLKSIPTMAFRNDKALQDIQLPGSLYSISPSAFEGCGLIEIVVPEGTALIYDKAFSDCCNLVTAVLPKSLKSLEYSAFNGCKALKKLTFGGPEFHIARTSHSAGKVAFLLPNLEWLHLTGDVRSDTDKCTIGPFRRLRRLTMDDCVEYIDMLDLSDNSLEELYISESLNPDCVSCILWQSYPNLVLTVKGTARCIDTVRLLCSMHKIKELCII